jgi:hypothetical protein
MREVFGAKARLKMRGKEGERFKSEMKDDFL